MYPPRVFLPPHVKAQRKPRLQQIGTFNFDSCIVYLHAECAPRVLNKANSSSEFQSKHLLLAVRSVTFTCRGVSFSLVTIKNNLMSCSNLMQLFKPNHQTM